MNRFLKRRPPAPVWMAWFFAVVLLTLLVTTLAYGIVSLLNLMLT